MRSAQEDFCQGFAAGMGVQWFMDWQKNRTDIPPLSPEEIGGLGLHAMSSPGFRPGIIHSAKSPLVRGAWEQWRKAEVAQGRPLVVVTDAPQSGEDGAG